jgi:oligopeptide/dipeptide ABC transporter ATP-binding protein
VQALLDVRNLKTHFVSNRKVVKAVDGISFYLNKGETVALVGESGCGKSASALSITRLIPEPPGKIVGGEVYFKGSDLLKATKKELRNVRGGQIAMIFQEPMTSLNPVLTIGQQISESLVLHLGLSADEALKRSIELLKSVGIPGAEKRAGDYPHQFSGGMRQRVMIAIALSCNPELLIADEPTTSVDVTTQAQLMKIMEECTGNLGTAMLLITHNLGLVARYASRVYVMYAGRIIESARAVDLYSNPLHPYTIGLLASVPRLDVPVKRELATIKGQPPDLTDHFQGCPFNPRCDRVISKCLKEDPELANTGDGHFVACWVALTRETDGA